MKTINVADVDYDASEIRKHATALAELRNTALEQGAMGWAVLLSHSVGLLNGMADMMEESL